MGAGLPRAYRLLQRLLPQTLRDTHGAAMEETFGLALDRARREGRMAVLRLWLREAWDHAGTGVKLRRAAAVGPAKNGRYGDEGRGSAWFEDRVREIGHAIRTLRKELSFSLAVVALFAVGIGASTAIFSLVDGVLLRSLVYDEPDRLYTVYSAHPEVGEGMPPSYPDFLDWREQVQSFESAAFVRGGVFTLRGDDAPVQLFTALASESFFQVLGARPHLGRTFAPDEESAAGDPVVVLSHRLWLREFGGDPGVVGRGATIDGRSYTVIGIMGPGFAFPFWAEAWLPLAQRAAESPALRERENRSDNAVVARLAPGASPDRAEMELDFASRQLAESYPANRGWTVHIEPLRDEVIGDAASTLLVFAAAVGLMLLVACANVTGLLIARGATRRREFALRTALGATRARLVSQLLTETLILALAGGALGLLVGHWLLSLVVAASPMGLPRLDEVGLDARAAFFASVVSVVSALAVGLLPAMRVSTDHVRDSLASGGRTGEPSARQRFRSGLVVAQVAVAFTLLIGAGLLVESLSRLQAVNPGFRIERLLTLRVFPPESYATEDAALRLYDRLANEISSVPGVEGVGYINHLPLTNMGVPTPVETDGGPNAERAVALYRTVDEQFQQTLQLPLLQGRGFTPEDMRRGSDVLLVNQAFARRFFPDGDAVGRRVTVSKQVVGRDDFGEPVTGVVAGVVGDVPFRALGQDPVPEVFLPLPANVPFHAHLVLRTRSDPRTVEAAVRHKAAAVEPELPLRSLETMEEIVSGALAQRRFTLTLVAAFAGAALLLTIIGLYGLLSYVVGQRRFELGVRIALGAKPGDVMRLVLGRGLLLVLGGLALGLAGALTSTKLIQGMLFGVDRNEPAVFASVALLLFTVAMFAVTIPAVRAARIDPNDSLRAK